MRRRRLGLGSWVAFSREAVEAVREAKCEIPSYGVWESIPSGAVLGYGWR